MASKLNVKHIFSKALFSKKQKVFCRAPFGALRFNRSGGVQVCCQHLDLQYLSDINLHDIWFGEQLQLMRQQMQHFDIPASCNYCKMEYQHGNPDIVMARSFDNLPINTNGYPSLMDFSLENTCNLKCIMCDASLSSSIEKSNTEGNNGQYNYDANFLEQLREFIPHLKTTLFSGGEPFLIDINYKIWALLLQENPNVVINVTTNGTVLNDRIKSMLYKGKFNITVSIDSFEKKHYEAIRVNANYEKTMANLRWFSEYCNQHGTKISVSACPMQINRWDIPGVLKHCNANNLGLHFNKVIKPWYQALWSLSSEELQDLHDYYAQSLPGHANTPVQKENKKAYSALMKQIEQFRDRAANRGKKNISDLHHNDFRKDAKITMKEIVSMSAISDDEKAHCYEKIDDSIDMLPDMLFTQALINRINNMNRKMLLSELESSSAPLLADHITILAYNAV
ncbi:MAG: radical SAM protein [Bacteroidales bacterium]